MQNLGYKFSQIAHFGTNFMENFFMDVQLSAFLLLKQFGGF